MNTIHAYQLRTGGTPQRLALFRQMAAASGATRNESTRLHPGDWKGARRYTLKTYTAAYATLDAGSQDGTPVWYSHAGPEFRNERDYSDVIGYSRHTGWNTDVDTNDSAVGIIAPLPHGRFIAGYRWTSNSERVYFPDVFTDEIDAARMADEHAQVFAESAMGDSERFHAVTSAEFEVESARDALQESIALRHRAKFGGFDRVRDGIETLRQARETLAAAERAYARGY